MGDHDELLHGKKNRFVNSSNKIKIDYIQITYGTRTEGGFMKINGISKLGKKLFFATLAVSGGAALISCGAQVTPSSSGSETSQRTDADTHSTDVSKSNTSISSNTSESVSSSEKSIGSTNTSETSSNSEQSSIQISSTSEEDSISKQIQEQLELYEKHIEATLKEKLNTKLNEDYVAAVDAKYFSFEQDAKYNTTFFVNGNITFNGDSEIHSVNLGLPLQGEDFANVSPLYYVDVVETNDLAQNYNVDDLAAVASYLDNEAITFTVADLDGVKWDINALTPAQIEQNLEQKYEQLARQTFKRIGNSEYIQNVDFKFFKLAVKHGYIKLLELCGNTANVFDDNILAFSVSFKLTDENYDKLKNQILTTTYDENADLRDNYTKLQLNEIVNIIDDDSTAIYRYTVDDFSYDAQIQERNM